MSGNHPTVLAALLLLAVPLAAQTPLAARRPPLQFMGFKAGTTLEQVAGTVRLQRGEGLACRTAAADSLVVDCRADIRDPLTGARLEVWLSAMDSLVGVLTVAGSLSKAQLDWWTSSLTNAYGPGTESSQGDQVTHQWIRHRQMLRLTHRVSADSGLNASISLVDGPVLDGWGRSRREGLP